MGVSESTGYLGNMIVLLYYLLNHRGYLGEFLGVMREVIIRKETFLMTQGEGEHGENCQLACKCFC